ncbi:methyl-accepting chemotaxis protein [Candidatus Nitrosotalea bavarica]|uniref:methyl-accepting chemotaxis protein n=1 Tax=Candidatus Nitrosotalea bavarica TaxID=1903277 RepID=UPI000C6FE92F|nr:HAMP domain-containing methyl-accepting chemotaxis protein [Candidatus Nitrosotalea bavarica]
MAITNPLTKSLNLKIIVMVNVVSALSIASISLISYYSLQQSDLQTLSIIIRYVITGIVMQCIVGAFAYFLAKSISGPILEMEAIARKISEGDLTLEISDSKSNDELGKLKNSFKEMLKGLRLLVYQVRDGSTLVTFNSEQVQSSTEQMNSSVQQISSTISQISKGSQLQAKELEETSRVVEKLTTDMKKLEVKSGMAAALAREVGLISETGSKSASEADFRMSKIISVTNDSSKKIRELVDRSREITTVLEVIRKIADQTNLLALNATIEAARAGEAGQGFAVVADEVKRLAEGSARSSEEIAELIAKIQEDAQSTVESIEGSTREVAEGRIVIDKALRSLNEIASKVKDVSINVLDVANTTKTQVSEIEKLSKASSEIAAVSEQNASATEQASAATEQQISGTQEIIASIQNMTIMAEDLSHTVSAFRLPENYKNESGNKKSKHVKKEVLVQ